MTIQDLTFTALHLGCTRDEQLLFKPVSFALKSGEALVIEGPNGIGKTTLLRVLAGLLPPECGTISALNTLAYLGPHNAVKGLLTPVEYLKYFASTPDCEENPSLRAQRSNPGGSEPGLLRGARNDEYRVQLVLEQLQLKNFEHKLCARLSSGQKQRVALARIVLSGAQLWILDEPMTALDKRGEQIFAQLLQTHLNQGGMAVIATHQALHDSHFKKIILEA